MYEMFDGGKMWVKVVVLIIVNIVMMCMNEGCVMDGGYCIGWDGVVGM